MKKFLAHVFAVVLTITLVLSVFPPVRLFAEATSEAYEGTTEISSYSELQTAFSSDNLKQNWRYVLTTDIDCGGVKITNTYPLYLGTNVTIDGQGHSIYNITVEDGLFNFTSASGTITFKNLSFGYAGANLSVKNALINKGDGKAPSADMNIIFENVNAYVTMTRASGGYIGAFFGRSTCNVSFTDCNVTLADAGSALYAGGFIGQHTSGDLSFHNCTVNGAYNANYITTNSETGAVTGGDIVVPGSGIAPNGGVGGFVGQLGMGSQATGNVVFTKCVNNANIGANIAAGGFVAMIKTAVPTVIFRSCVNNGSIDGNNVMTGKVDESARIGGFVGASYSTYGITFDRCINNGNVSNAGFLGGLLGFADSGLVTFDHSQNNGTITAKSGSHMGGLSGRLLENAKFQNCINTGTLTTSDSKTVGNVGQLASKVDSTLTVINCAGVGTWDCTGTYCGALIGNVVSPDVTYSGNKYITASCINKYFCVDQAADAIAAADVEAVIKGYTMAGDDGEDVISAPALRAVQETTPVSGLHNIRLVATVDTKNYQTGGFVLTVKTDTQTYTENKQVSCTYLYNSITASADGEAEAVAAEDPILAGNYIMALAIVNVPTNIGAITIEAKPYTITADGTRYEGDTVSLVYTYTADGTAIASVKSSSADLIDHWNSTFTNAFPFYTGGEVSDNTFTNNIVYGETTRNTSEYKMFAATGTTAEEFSAYVETLKTNGCTVTAASDQNTGVTGYWVTKDNVRMYMYMSAKNGVARFILENSDVQTTAQEFSYTYEKQSADTTTFYLYGLYQNEFGVNGASAETDGNPEQYLAFDKLTNKDPSITEAEYLAALAAAGVSVGETNYSNKNTGMLLVVKLADNSVILVDGGQVAQMSQEAAVELNDFLHEITGTSDTQKVTIRAWYLTHWHGDHYEGFIRFINAFHELYDLERVMFNLLEGNGDLAKLFGEDYLQSYYPDLTFHRLHTGETIQMGDVSIDVMYTQEDLVYPETATLMMPDDNDSSNVLRLRFDGISVMVTGDLSTSGQAALLDMYDHENGALEVDVFQTPHHSWNNLPALFAAVNPEVVLHAQSSGGVRYKAYTTTYTSLINAMKNPTTLTGAATKDDNHYYAGDYTVGLTVKNGVIEFSQPQGNDIAGKMDWDDTTGADGGNWDKWDEMSLDLLGALDDGWGIEINFSTGE